MTTIRIGVRLREYLYGVQPDSIDHDPGLFELVEYIQGFPLYPAGIELPERFWPDVWYYAGLLESSEPDEFDLRSVNAALKDLTAAGYNPRKDHL